MVSLDVPWRILEGQSHIAVGSLLLCHLHEVLGELAARIVIVETQMENRRTAASDETLHLPPGGVAAGGDEDGLPETLVLFAVKLVVCHRVIGALEEENPPGILEPRPRRGGYPEPDAGVAPGGFPLIRRSAVPLRTAAFLETHDGSVTARHGDREGEVPVRDPLPALGIPVRQNERITERQLRPDVYSPVFEEGVKRLPGLLRILIHSREPVIIQTEGLEHRFRFPDLTLFFLVGGIEKTAADLVDEKVEVHAHGILRE